ncbi:helix-turn-helix domain-containing protein [Catenulispora sp. NL8]|uniref:Helix-turn-helix domain-containing protein n=1 Tax=Catenulispora pinistramenti TaxID=2705254 RepID=A0ABS5KN39_9ACTN|nr:helix-turn-helix transcriptional regulator [Catenulispora pinistramenti]MBS2547445.1 helix-turn-helix domain-containing protein [Catenulispora pinistramenti]
MRTIERLVDAGEAHDFLPLSRKADAICAEMSTPRHRTGNNDADRFPGDSFSGKGGIMTEELGAELRAARRRSGLAFNVFARAAGYSESHLRNVENGTKPVTCDVAKAYDRVLATGGAFGAMVDGTAAQEAPWNRQGAFAALTEMANGGGLDRRNFVVTTGAAALTTLIGHWSTALGAQDEPATASSPPLVAAPRLLGHIEKRLDYLRHLDDEFGSGDIARYARSELAMIVELLRAGHLNGTAEDNAYSMASEAARQVAWNMFDSGRHASAERFFETSLRASATAGDAIAGAYAMSFMAIQHYTAGNPQNAVNLLDAAETSVSRNATPKMRAMLAARKARALSKTNDLRGSARALEAARVLVDKGPHDDDPPFLYWVTRGEVEMIAGSSALEMNDPSRALSCFNAAQAVYPGDVQYPRSHAIYLARAAEAHLAMHDLDAAVAQARHAARCLGSVDSARSSSTLVGLRRKLAAHTSNPAVREFLQVG